MKLILKRTQLNVSISLGRREITSATNAKTTNASYAGKQMSVTMAVATKTPPNERLNM